MIGPTPFAIALSLLVSSSTTIQEQRQGQRQYDILGHWLQRNKQQSANGSAVSTISTSTSTNTDPLLSVNSECAVDENGLRGLKWRPTMNTRGDRSLYTSLDDKIACRIPVSCTIVADKIIDNERPIDALVRTVYCRILQRSSSNAVTDYEPYFATLPAATDPSLKFIGSRWERVQLEHLLGHTPTVEKFENWKAKRNEVIARIMSMKDIGDMEFPREAKPIANEAEEKAGDERRLAAEWAYDLVTSRSIQGNFGHQGRLRAAVAAWLASSGIATLPFFFMSDHDTLPILSMVASILPLLVSSLMLAYLQISSKTKGPEIAMLPWIDLANHKSGTKMTLEYDMFQDSIVWKRSSISEMKDSNQITGDSEWITFDYGGETGASNDHLLGVYGFVETDNPNDTIDLELRKSDEHDQSIVSIGRYGKIVGDSGSGGGSRSQDYESLLIESAKRARRNILEKGFHEAITVAQIDPTQADLAKMWRTEKIRLLDEFIEVNGR